MKRLLLALIALGVSVVWTPDAFAETVSGTCDTPVGSDTCNRWYTDSMVTLSWSHEPAGGGLVSGCATVSFTKEALPVERQCTWHWTTSDVTLTK